VVERENNMKSNKTVVAERIITNHINHLKKLLADNRKQIKQLDLAILAEPTNRRKDIR